MMFDLRQFKTAALALVLLTVVTRLPSLLHPLPIDDEAPYAVVANEILDGGQLYVDAVDRKPPLLFWTYAAIFEVAGKYNWFALHVVALAWVLGTMAGLYLIGRELFDRETGLVAALLYSIFQIVYFWKDLALNGEMLMNLPIVWAWAIAFRKNSSHVRLDLLGAGALLALAFLLKQPAAIAAVPLGIYLLLGSYRRSRGLNWISSITQGAMLTAGFAGMLGLIALVLRRQGVLEQAYYWTITSHADQHVFLAKGFLFTLLFVSSCLPLILGAALAYRDREKIWSDRKAERMALFGLLVASMIGTAAGVRFHPHYYIQLIPPLALLAAPHFAQLWSGKIRAQQWLLRPAVLSRWLILIVAGFLIFHSLELATKRQMTESGRYLHDHSLPNERIFVWGHKAMIYLEAQRRPASRFILTFPLTGYVFGGPLPNVDTSQWIMPGAWTALESDFARHPPRYIVDLQSEPDAQYPIKNFPILAHQLADHYQRVTKTAEGVIYRRHDG